MRAAIINNPGPNSSITITTMDKPTCQPKEILIKVGATALNRADILQRSGKYPPPPGASNIPGLEVAGDVVEIGSDVKSFKIGERVYGLIAGGGYAEYCVVEEGLAFNIPDDWRFDYAAAIPEALTTAHATVFELGNLSENQTFLIHGAGSGIATTAIQMAKTIRATIYTTVGDPAKVSKAKELGASMVYNYKTDPWFDIIEHNTLDVIVDFIGGDYFSKHTSLLAKTGHLIQIACMKDHKIETSLLPILQKRLNIHGFVLRSQALDEKKMLWQQAHKRWFNHYESGKIKPIIDSIYSLEDIEKAHEHMKSSTHFGKIVIQI
jgi:NADPH:quinone reductase